MDISDITNDNKNAPSSGQAPAQSDGASGGQKTAGQSGGFRFPDPLADFTADDGKKFKFNTNKTIDTSDDSIVGDFNAIKSITPVTEDGLPVVDDDRPEIISPAKMDFIKTYTKEYDDLVAATTHAVELILASIDKTVEDHSNDIKIPEEALPFIAEKPKDNKVPKFDDAQEIVRSIMQQATSAKVQSENAAREASKIYDNIQQFKRDTSTQIEDIRNRDEFGHPKRRHGKNNVKPISDNSTKDGTVEAGDGAAAGLPKISRGL